MFRINYILKKPERIAPWGEESKHLHWFGLTDGLLWISAGDAVIYEYDKPYPDRFGEQIKYNDYYLSRFIEDILELAPFISESVPESLFNVIEDMADDLQAFKDKYIDRSDEEFEAFYDDVFEPLSGWFYSRFLSSGHLVCGPSIGFIRCGDRIKIIWDSDPMKDATAMWKYPRGIFETDYRSFVSEVSGFINSFTADMDDQVSDVANNGIPGVYVDVDALIRENTKRKEAFEHQLKFLYSESKQGTDWNAILDLYELMCKELGKD